MPGLYLWKKTEFLKSELLTLEVDIQKNSFKPFLKESSPTPGGGTCHHSICVEVVCFVASIQVLHNEQ